MIKINSYNLKFLNPDESIMRDNGFTDHDETHWSYWRKIGDYETIYIEINKSNHEVEEAYILDHMFGQPSLANTSNTKFAKMMREIFKNTIDKFIDKGIFSVDESQ